MRNSIKIRFPLAIILVAFFLSTINVHSQELELSLNPGPFKVGVRFVETTDYSRAYGENQGRPIRGLIWYPSESMGEQKATLSDYLSKSKLGLDVWQGYFGQLEEGMDIEAMMAWESLSYKEPAINSKSDLPVIIYSPAAFGDEFENILICEYLASHGYVVASHYSIGPNSSSTKLTPEGLESQARDTEFMIQEVKRIMPEADISKLGLLGWSWGGLSSMLLQVRNLNVDAVVSLDGSMALHSDKINQTAFFDVQKINVPYLFMSASGTKDQLSEFLSSVKYSEAFYMEYPHLEHGDFSSLNYIGYMHQGKALTIDEKKKKESYLGLVNSTVEFFGRNLRKETGEGLRQVLNDQKEAGILIFRELSALPKPPAGSQFFENLLLNKIAESQEIFDRTYKNDPDFKLFKPDEAIEFAYELHGDHGESVKAIALLKMSLVIFPEHYQTYGHLGNLLYRTDNLKDALVYFSKASAMVGTPTSKADRQNLDWYNRSIDRIKDKID